MVARFLSSTFCVLKRKNVVHTPEVSESSSWGVFLWYNLVVAEGEGGVDVSLRQVDTLFSSCSH